RRVAAKYPGKLVIFFRWGDNTRNPTGNGFSGGNLPYVAMPALRSTNAGLRCLAHEVGHYFGLGHTFARQLHTVDQAAEYLRAHDNKLSAFDGDGLPDTLPDPGLDLAFNNGVTQVTLNGTTVPLPTGNIMSYMNWDGHEWMSARQALQVRAMYRFRSRYNIILPTNQQAPSPIEAESLPHETAGKIFAMEQPTRGFGIGFWSGDAHLFGN